MVSLMDLGICMRDLPVDEVVRLGKFAEDNGYASIYLPETGNHQPSGGLSGRSPYISLAAMFAVTYRKHTEKHTWEMLWVTASRH